MARSDHPAHSHGQVGIKERHMSLADAPLLPVPGTDGVEIFHDHLQRELQKPGTGRWPAGTSRRPLLRMQSVGPSRMRGWLSSNWRV